jgi:hypothetical protein
LDDLPRPELEDGFAIDLEAREERLPPIRRGRRRRGVRAALSDGD